MSAQGSGFLVGVENPGSASCVPLTYVRRKPNRCAPVSSRHGSTIRKLGPRICQALSDTRRARARRFRATVMPDRHLSRRPDAHALARRRPRIASRRAGPADPAAPQGHEGRRPRCDPPHGAIADRHHSRRRAQPVSGAVQPRRQLRPALARRASRRSAPVRILVARSVLPARRAVRADALQDARPARNGMEIRGRLARAESRGDRLAAGADPRARPGEIGGFRP